MTEQQKPPRSLCLPGRRKHQFADRDSHTELKPYMCCFHCGKSVEQAMREGNKSRYVAAKEKKTCKCGHLFSKHTHKEGGPLGHEWGCTLCDCGFGGPLCTEERIKHGRQAVTPGA